MKPLDRFFASRWRSDDLTPPEAARILMDAHYLVFMANPRFWYDKALQAADTLICVAASNLRQESRHGYAVLD